MQELTPDWLAFAQKHLGEVKKVTVRGWKHLETGVWELEAERGRAFLKNHRQKAKFEQELSVFQNILPYALAVTPSLLAYDKAQRIMLLSAVPGELVDDLTETHSFGDAVFEVYQQAGQFLRSYHDVPYKTGEELGVDDAVWQRAESWFKGAIPYVARADIDWFRDQVIEMLPALKTQKRVPCHRDYTGRNWLWQDKL